jgi:hypothetical protein
MDNSAMSTRLASIFGLVFIVSMCGDRWPSQEATAACTTEVKIAAELGTLDDPASIREPVFVDVARLASGGWIVAEDGNDLIEYSSDGSFRRFFGSRGEGPGEVRWPTRVAVDASDSLWVSDNRGRAVIFGPSGNPTRTLIRPALFRIDGFTPSGLPYSMLTRDSGTPSPSPHLFGFVQVWSREGDPLHSLGPGHFDPRALGRIVLPLIPPQSQPVSDTGFLTPGGWKDWVVRWTPSVETAFVSAGSVWEKLGLGNEPSGPDDGHPISVITDGIDGSWVIGAIRRLGRDREAEVHQAAVGEGNRPESPLWRFSPVVRNAVFDGAVVHVTSDGAVTEGATFGEYPWGFASPEHFFTFHVLANGLIQIRIWKFRLTCG